MTPELNETNSTRIHPAIDFTSDRAYVGQTISSGREQRLYLVRDDGRIFQFDGNSLECENLGLTHRPISIEPRWSHESITRFSRGETEITANEQLFQAFKRKFEFYLELPDERLYDLLTLWVIGTHFHPLFNTYPYIYVGGISLSGKTKVLTLCSCLGFNSVLCADLSTAVLYRLIQDGRCSLFIDEAEDLHNRYLSADFRRILLSGYKKGLRVYRSRRTEDGNFTSESFEVYGPKMLANIEGLESVLGSRCITIAMERTINNEISSREISIEDTVWQQTRDLVYPFLMRNWGAVKQAYLEIQNTTTLLNRDWELWKPILALARFFGSSTLYEEMRDLASEKATERQSISADPYEIALAETLLSLVDHDCYYSLADIRNGMFRRLEDDEFLSSRQVGGLLRRCGFTQSRRMNSGYHCFLHVSRVRTLAQRLGVSEGSEHSEHTAGQGIQTVIDHVETVEIEKCREEKSE